MPLKEDDNPVSDDDVYLGLGSNLGDRAGNLRAGLAGLCAGGLRLRAVSSFYLTEPDLRPTSGSPANADTAAEGSSHPRYVNCVAAFDAGLEPRALLELCLAVERRQGRERRRAPAPAAPEPRTLDIDVLMIGQRVVDRPGLKVPHPLMLQRRFVLRPLTEIAPSLRHPLVDGTMAEALARLPGEDGVSLLEPPPKGVF